jgi:hypothetical protein
MVFWAGNAVAKNIFLKESRCRNSGSEDEGKGRELLTTKYS